MAYTTIDDPSVYFQTLLYTGDDNNNRALTNDGNSDLQPDLVWIKNTSGGTKSHQLVDSSGGVTKYNFTDDNSAETTLTNRLDSFDSDGFTTDNHSSVNASDREYAAFQWKANAGTTTSFTESGNNPGGTHQANTTAGFSIVRYTGTGAIGTVQHGLGKKPFWMLGKRLESDDNWSMYHESKGATHRWKINEAGAAQDTDSIFNDTEPTSSVFTLKTNNEINGDAETYLMYCWAPIKGFSSFGIIRGNGSENGPRIYTGFRPGWIMYKEDEAQGGYGIWNVKTSPNNPMRKRLLANNNSILDESDDNAIDILSNGFKLRTDSGGFNQDGRDMVYMAFAEHPFVTSGGVPVTAR